VRALLNRAVATDDGNLYVIGADRTRFDRAVEECDGPSRRTVRAFQAKTCPAISRWYAGTKEAAGDVTDQFEAIVRLLFHAHESFFTARGLHPKSDRRALATDRRFGLAPTTDSPRLALTFDGEVLDCYAWPNLGRARRRDVVRSVGASIKGA